MRVRARVAYHGADFHGFAENLGVRSIAGDLNKAISLVLGKPISVTCAGRTDKGVHAIGQVVSFDVPDGTSLERLASSVNSQCGPSVLFTDLKFVDQEFDARFSAVSRTYSYRILNSPDLDPFLVDRAWHIPIKLDVDSMQLASKHLIGEHDFSSFCKKPKLKSGDTVSLVRYVIEKGEIAGLVDVRVAAALTEGRAGGTPAPFEELYSAGVRVFTDDGDTLADGALMKRIMFELAEIGGIVSQHAVDPDLAKGGHLRAGSLADRFGIKGIPARAEEVVIARDLELVRDTGCAYHIQHLSTEAGVELVSSAKREGLPVTAEVTPHHLAFEVSALENLEGNYKMMPPLGTSRDRDALRKAVLSGVIDSVATDHAPHTTEEKHGPFEDAEFGVIGLADAAPIVHTVLNPGPRVLFARMSEAPARIGGVDGHGVWISVGSPANLAVFDPNIESVPAKTFSKSLNSPYVGRKRRGEIRYTIYRGRVTRALEVVCPS